MTKTKKTKGSSKQMKALEKKVASMKVTQKQKQKSTPFASAGETVGKTIGSMFGNSKVGSGIGKWLGQGIGAIFGSGDYTMSGPRPNYNVLTNTAQIPQFSTTHATDIVRKREYLGDITGTTNFTNHVYPLNPGMSNTFPWLSVAAQAYQEYRFHGLIFEFRPLITDFVTNGAPGVVTMSTNYNAVAPSYVNRQQMENAEFAVSVKPTNEVIHGIECAVNQTTIPQRYVRSGAVPSGADGRLYDWGNFQLATQGNPNQVLGELWVSYVVEFFKPILPSTPGGIVDSAHLIATSGSGSNPLGTTLVANAGTLAVTWTASSLAFSVSPSSQFIITLAWNGSNASISFPAITLSSNLSLKQRWNNNASSYGYGYGSGLSAGTASVTFVVADSGVGGASTVTIATNGTLPTSSNVDVYITELDNSLT